MIRIVPLNRLTTKGICMFKMKITLCALCISFAPINGFLNNVGKTISKFDVYKTLCSSRLKLYEVVATSQLINNGLIIPVIAYREVYQKSYGDFHPIGELCVETEETFIKDKTEYYTAPHALR